MVDKNHAVKVVLLASQVFRYVKASDCLAGGASHTCLPVVTGVGLKERRDAQGVAPLDDAPVPVGQPPPAPRKPARRVASVSPTLVAVVQVGVALTSQPRAYPRHAVQRDKDHSLHHPEPPNDRDNRYVPVDVPIVSAPGYLASSVPGASQGPRHAYRTHAG